MALLYGLLLALSLAPADVVTVGDDAALRAALRDAAPGKTIRIMPGSYRGGLWLERSGTPERPIVIEAADPAHPPVIEGGDEGLHLAGCSHVTLRNLHFRGQRHNGLNIDDGGRVNGPPARGIVLEGLHVSDVDAGGNHDGIKLSGLAGLRVAGCTVEGWGGSAIDLVGCHDGVIEGCALRGADEIGTGIQIKGGSSKIVVRGCDFLNAGQRALNLGGSTGLAFFRPPDATAEARTITVEHCRFVGSLAPLAFVGSEEVTVRRNTFLHPKRWVLRILQETRDERFVPCRRGRFEENVIVFRAGELRSVANIGDGTAAETFEFADNLWYCEDAPERSRPSLPSPERGGVYGVDPALELDEKGLPTIAPGSPAAGRGASDTSSLPQ